jgi:hypothetical protein
MTLNVIDIPMGLILPVAYSDRLEFIVNEAQKLEMLLQRSNFD